jgi:hypothetical protein
MTEDEAYCARPVTLDQRAKWPALSPPKPVTRPSLVRILDAEGRLVRVVDPFAKGRVARAEPAGPRRGDAPPQPHPGRRPKRWGKA